MELLSCMKCLCRVPSFFYLKNLNFRKENSSWIYRFYSLTIVTNYLFPLIKNKNWKTEYSLKSSYFFLYVVGVYLIYMNKISKLMLYRVNLATLHIHIKYIYIYTHIILFIRPFYNFWKYIFKAFSFTKYEVKSSGLVFYI